MAAKKDPNAFDWNTLDKVLCAQCKIPGTPVRDIVPFGIKSPVMLHDDCWRTWMDEKERSR